MIKHVSFDVWNTLISPNPKFAQRRTEALAEKFRVSEKIMKGTYTNIKRALDQKAESLGKGFSNDLVIAYLIAKLSGIAQVSVEEVKQVINSLFIAYPPIVYPEIEKVIHTLRKNGITTSIMSNTNFISGVMLGEFLTNEYGKFDFMLFSDLLPSGDDGQTITKPNQEIFTTAWTLIRLLDENISTNEILHIGDNRICDFDGAAKCGFRPKLISSPTNLPGALFEELV